MVTTTIECSDCSRTYSVSGAVPLQRMYELSKFVSDGATDRCPPCAERERRRLDAVIDDEPSELRGLLKF